MKIIRGLSELKKAPLVNLAPQRSPKLLCTFREKMEQIEASGMDVVICAKFTPEFAALHPEDFVREVLVGTVGVKDLFIGHDYAFGKDRKGDTEFLRDAGARNGFGVHVVGPVKVEGIRVSSTKIRQLVMDGEVCLASKLLGRPYSIEGSVISGHARGRELGFPTANITTPNELPPREGVYAVSVDVEGKNYHGAANIGKNPTFGDDKPSYEVHLLDFDGDLYGKFIKIKFIKRVRDEFKFKSVDELVKQIHTDVKRIRAVFSDEA
ncbi:MAG: bifunctional riboflavin kinase/FAD synthetase [Nitrospirae bacterium]|nr:bifunctional riboflavin kinase/FAD synthetase [Nitrospirota bacterium]